MTPLTEARPNVSTQAVRLTRQHNNDAHLVSGYIYAVNLQTGKIGALVATYAADQIGPDHAWYGRIAFLRISHGRITQAQAQRFIDQKGKGF